MTQGAAFRVWLLRRYVRLLSRLATLIEGRLRRAYDALARAEDQ